MVFRLLEIQLLSWRYKHTDRCILFTVYLLLCMAECNKKTAVVSSSLLHCLLFLHAEIVFFLDAFVIRIFVLLLFMFLWCLESLLCKF